MPLYKRRTFSLLESPKDLDAHDFVFQIRFTKEIFRDYEYPLLQCFLTHFCFDNASSLAIFLNLVYNADLNLTFCSIFREYLKRLNLYRQRLWTCKVTGKTNLTYEEALVSEHHATEKVQQFPKDFIAPVLRMIQFSTATLKDLVDEMYDKLQESLFEGLELQGRKDDTVVSCKVLEILNDGDALQYRVGWIDKYKKIFDSSIVKAEDLIHTKRPFSRRVLREFIRESTRQAAPWVIHDKLAKEHGIATEPPEEMRDQLILQNGSTWITKKSSKDSENLNISKKRKEFGNENLEDLGLKIKKGYPIDDLLVRPAPNDPIFTERPPLTSQFNVPMDCVGDLLMVWDFCCTFGKLLHLWPFALDDFENAICHKDSNLILTVEIHSSILNLLIKDEGEYFLVIKDRRRKSKIKLSNWTEFLCDFLEMKDREGFSSHLGTIKRGHYGLLETHLKLSILRELIREALETNAIRGKLDERFEQQQALAAIKRDEARRKKLKVENSDKETNEVCITENGNRDDQSSALKETDAGHVNEVHLPDKADNRERKHQSSAEASKKLNMENGYHTKSMKGQRRGKDKEKEAQDKKPDATGEHLEREIEKLSVRTNSLGKDRNYNRYWFFRREGRLFVESSDSMQWGYYTTKEELDALLGSLNPKGERERGLKRQLEKYYNRISLALHKRSKDIAQKILLEENVLRRSTRVRAQPRDGSATAFLRYVNKWREI
ncbi:DDT domain-containing protein [Canna indica]|uniref:DDT domain-containing protein n=1 Tax=Canna indica TaxID=4628 RepID=A0AAQ3Q3R1_9LILI|nr:DDT domain-containing protein [Canna indica]